MGRLAFIIVVCLYCAETLAVGDNSHPQGVRFAGLGFDEQQPLQSSQWVPRFGNSIWPPQGGTYNSIDGPTQIRVEAQCEQSPQDPSPDPLFALCYGTVFRVDSGKAVAISACDSQAPRRSGRRAVAAPSQKENVPLLAIRGKLNNASGVFEPDSQVLTFACAPMFKKKPPPRWLYEIPPITGAPGDPKTNLDQSDNLGVLAKCYFWGFAQPKETEKSRLATYQACLRAARAEYCGGGISQTKTGTFIQVYEPIQTKVGVPVKVTLDKPKCDNLKDPKTSDDVTMRQPLKFKVCFEALWDSEGALCVSHARFQDMPAEECKKQFKQELSVEMRGADIFAFPAKSTDKVYLNCQTSDYQGAVQKARVKNRSGINKLDGEVMGCVNDIPCP